MTLTTAHLTTTGKIINLSPPHDMNSTGLTTSTCDIFSMKGYDKATIVLQFGVINDSATVGTLTVEKCTDVAGSNNTAMAFTYRAEGTSGGDTLDAITQATSSGVALAGVVGVVDNTMVTIELRAEELVGDANPNTAATNFTSVSVLLGNSAHSVLISAVAVLHGAHYQNSALLTAITD